MQGVKMRPLRLASRQTPLGSFQQSGTFTPEMQLWIILMIYAIH